MQEFCLLQAVLKRCHEQLGVVSQSPRLSTDAEDTQKLCMYGVLDKWFFEVRAP